MADFAEQVRQRIREQVDEAARRQAEADEQRRKALERHARAEQTLPEIDSLFREAATASDGRLRYVPPPTLIFDTPKSAAGAQGTPLTFHLYWEGPGGPRQLTLSVSTLGHLEFESTGPKGRDQSSARPDEPVAPAVQREILRFIDSGLTDPYAPPPSRR